MNGNQVTPMVNSQPGQPGMQQPPPVWMPKPSGPGGCPAGLEYLTTIDQILIKQQIDLMEVFTAWEVQNRYRILNTVGQQVYFANEESDHCERQCCLSNRGFIMHVTDNLGAEVIRVTREFRCCSANCFAGCAKCAHYASIEAPPGQVVGSIRQRASFCSPNFVIQDAHGNDVFYVTGPCHLGMFRGCPCDVTFNLLSAKDGVTEVGTIQKQWSNLLQEAFTSADNFGVKFPLDLDVKMKATVIGATFLIDFLFFEVARGGGRRHHRHGYYHRY